VFPQKSARKHSRWFLFLVDAVGWIWDLRGGFEILGKKYQKNNFEISWANDVDQNACLTYVRNFNDSIVCGDISEILNGIYPADALEMPKSADVVLGGFPCQDFSLSGKRKGFAGTRGKLYQSMVGDG
jgi:DNA (cytosine-5)-methyltransferase 1